MNFLKLLKTKHNLLSAHRGARDIAPENTLLAFRRAIELNADFIELDVGFSSDGVAIIIHDDTFNRTTNAELLWGEREHKIFKFKYDEILKLDASYEFLTKDPFGTISSGRVDAKDIEPQIVPTLKEVLELCKEHNMFVNVEIKDLSQTPFNSVAVDKVLKIIKQSKTQDLVLISSFNHSYLKEIKQKSNLPIAVLQERVQLDDPINYLQEIGATAYHCDKEIVDSELVAKLNSVNIFTNVFTVNDPKEQKKLFSIGVKAIFTDCL